MLVTTLRPDGDVRLGPFTVTGAATVAAALADESAASYIDTAFSADYAEVSLPTWAKGASTLTSIAARATNDGGPEVLMPRVDIVTGSTVLAVGVFGTYPAPNPPPTTYAGDLTQAQIDDLRIRLYGRNDMDSYSAVALYVDVNADFPLGASTTVTIDSVTTEDAAPTGPPHVISTDPDHDDAEVRFTATHDGQLIPFDGLVPSDTLYPGVHLDVIGYKLVVGSLSAGKPVAQQTNRVSPNRVCGARSGLREAVSPDGFRVASGTQVVVRFTFADASDGGADGPRTVSVFALTDMQGWA